MTRFRFAPFLTILILALMTLSALADSREIALFQEGRVRFWIETNDRIRQKCGPAILDFQQIVLEMTGSPIPDKSRDDEIPLKLEIVAPEKTLPLFEAGARAGDYEWEVSPEAIVIRATAPLGITNGLYGLLDYWGCRWAFPGELGAAIPKKSHLHLPLGNQRMSIASDPRIMSGPPSYYSEGEVGDWIRRLRFGKEAVVTAHHHWCGIVPPGIYNDPAKPETYHPEYFSLIGERRVSGTNPHKIQICTTNPDVIRMGIEKAKAYFRRGAITFPCSPEDNSAFCQCPSCLALDPSPKASLQSASMTDRVISFANEIAKGVKEEFPGRLVAVFAYPPYIDPPHKVTPESNVMVDVTRFQYDLLKLVPRKQGDSAGEFNALVDSWLKLTPYLYLHEYNPIYWTGGLFCPNYLEYAKAVRFYREKGVLGFRSDSGGLPFRNRINFLNDYLAMRVAVDGALDPEKELESLCGQFFGPAAAEVLKYYRAMARVTEQDPVPGFYLGGGIRHFHKMFTPSMIKEGTAQLQEARKAVGDATPYSERVQIVEMSHRYLSNYLRGIEEARAGNYEGALDAFSDMRRSIDTLGSNHILDNASHQQRMMQGAALMALAEYCPGEAGFVINWKVLGPFNNSDATAEHQMAIYEPVTNITTSVSGNDGIATDWKDYNSSSGFLAFDKAFPETPKDWRGFTAYAAVRIAADRPAKVKLQCNSWNSFRIYLNGKEIFYRIGANLDLPNTHNIAASLEEGENTLIVRCTGSGRGDPNNPFGLYLRILDASVSGERTSIPGVRIE